MWESVNALNIYILKYAGVKWDLLSNISATEKTELNEGNMAKILVLIESG